MQRFLAMFGHWLHTLAFAAWFGGMLAIGALVAPTAFAVNRPFAGQMLESVFRQLNTLSFVCAGIMLAATWAEWRVQSSAARRLLYVRGALTAAALALALYLGVRLLPIMIHLRSAGRVPSGWGDFDRLHHVYEAVSQTQFWLLAAVAACTAGVGSWGLGAGAGAAKRHAGLAPGTRPVPTPNPQPPTPGAKRP